MFEDSTFESQGRITTASSRWSLATFALNGSVLAAMILFPLIHPEGLPHRFIDIALTPPPAPHEAPQQTQTRATVFHGRPELTPLGLTVPTQIPKILYKSETREFTAISDPLGIGIPGTGTGIPGGADLFRTDPPQPVQPKPKGPISISQGVALGMVLHKVVPVYPAIARASRTEGTVILHAVISKDGAIEDLRVEGGPAMLQQAALDAVRQWRYRPYLLNGAPVAVETTINVVFSLGR